MQALYLKAAFSFIPAEKGCLIFLRPVWRGLLRHLDLRRQMKLRELDTILLPAAGTSFLVARAKKFD